MDLPFTIKIRWEYLASVVAGTLILGALIAMCFYFSVDHDQIDFQSTLLWFGVVLLIALARQLFGVRSIRRSILITEEGLMISYLFKKKKIFIGFADVVGFRSTRNSTETVIYPARTDAHFTLALRDGRDFGFDRSEIADYEMLRTTVFHLLEKRNQQ
jgi:hypothetical protein